MVKIFCDQNSQRISSCINVHTGNVWYFSHEFSRKQIASETILYLY